MRSIETTKYSGNSHLRGVRTQALQERELTSRSSMSNTNC